MKRLTVMTAVLAISAAAQTQTFTAKKVGFSNNVMGTVVKGAPYSGDEITESLQVLADGTRISNQSKASVYRDGEGRVRRETDQAISIWDPVENVTYELNKSTMKGVKVSMARTNASLTVRSADGLAITVPTVSVATSASLSAGSYQLSTESQNMSAMMDKLRAEAQFQGMTVNGASPDPQKAAAVKEQLDQAMATLSQMDTTRATFTKTVTAKSAGAEQLGQQVMEGLTAEGTRTTVTLEAGAIGNDRPIHVVSERWYSPELQTVVMTRHSDPRSGDETFRLSNVRKGEPGADLFMLPPGYQLQDSASQWKLTQKKEE